MSRPPPTSPRAFNLKAVTPSTRSKYDSLELETEYDGVLFHLHFLDTYLAVPLAILGLLLNAVSLWVWHANPVYDGTVLVLKCLALWDMLFAGLCAVWLLLPLPTNLLHYGPAQQLIWHTGNVCQMVTVYLTVYLVFVRLQAVRRTGSACACCVATRRRILATNGVLVLCGVCLEIMEIMIIDFSNIPNKFDMLYLRRFLALWLPLVPMVVLFRMLVSRVCAARDADGSATNVTSSPTTTASPDPETASNASDPPFTTTREPVRVSRRLTGLVLWVSGYTVLVYIAWFIIKSREILFKSHVDVDLLAKFFVWLFVLLKSVINPVFCVAISPCFRHLLRARVSRLVEPISKRCCRGCRCVKNDAVSELPLMELQEE